MKSIPIVLVVDDESHMLRLCGRILAPLGCEVVFADSFSAAIGRLNSLEALDLLVTDIMLPDGSGLDIIRAARLKFPSVSVMVMTGLLTVEEEELGDLKGIIRPEIDVFQKPFDMENFEREVRARLGLQAPGDNNAGGEPS